MEAKILLETHEHSSDAFGYFLSAKLIKS